MEASAEQFVRLPHGGRICYQTFGPRDGTPVLLLSGGGQSMLSWHEDFIAQLAAALSPANTAASSPSSSSPSSGGYLIVRYDTRDTGRSTHYACLPESDPRRRYTLDDLLADALALLDHLGGGGASTSTSTSTEAATAAAHLVGFSMGGATAWMLAAREPSRVRSLTLVSSSPVGPGGDASAGIPGVDAALRARIEAVPRPDDWSTDRDAVVRFLTGFEACMVDETTQAPLTEPERDEIAQRAGWASDRAAQAAADAAEYEHKHKHQSEGAGEEEEEGEKEKEEEKEEKETAMQGQEKANVGSFFNQAHAAWGAPWPRSELRRVRCGAPGAVAVVHGAGDGNLPLRHGEVLAEEMPGARLVVVPGMGHELRRRHWGVVVDEVCRVVAAAEAKAEEA
ncbi:alpha/beta fold family hydrolase [Purpureocillium lavendulum]|uniref:Alpha/beta fold family hydrolase n=1 Tax=Purpureocillium lavendulum TaxID=1247861 RepID=A0AB34FWK6_9HYPO|nr:alpha/beta fold family hydrolase [Purpureocillium lavendulum]